MDDKLRSVLNNPQLLAQIAAAVKGAASGEETESAPQYAPRENAIPAAVMPTEAPNDKAMALLAALRPFLSSARRDKLETVTKAMAVANIYKNTKNI